VVSLAEPPAAMKHQELLGPLLKHVSRSFYLTLKAVPRDLQRPIGLAYLLARAADTITDTALISRADRLKYLELFRDAIREGRSEQLPTIAEALVARQQDAAERELLTRLEEGFAILSSLSPDDQAMIRNVVLTLTKGMVMDLTTFPGEDEGRLIALETRVDLDRYTYYVAGCAGEFWTDIHLAHRPSLADWNRDAMRQRGVRFGKGLQMTNILRDLSKDLRIGRCYLPRQELEVLGLQPADLLNPSAIAKVKPLLRSLLALALEHYQEGWAYTLAIPRYEVRMRLACVLPLFIGLKTLALLERSPNLLDPNVVIKIPRGTVYGIVARSLVRIGSDSALDRYYCRLRQDVLISQ